MKKLFLTSVKLDKLLDILPSNKSNLNIVFIPTAADPYEDKWFVELDRKKFIDLGLQFKELDLKNKNQKDIEKELEGVDVVYVSGGNSFYLLEKVKESGFDKVLPPLVENGVIYAGSSAGAVLAGPTIKPIKLLDDPSKVPGLKSYDGLNLVNFVVLPHYGKEKYKDKFKNIMEEYGKTGLKLLTITDEQAIIVEGDNYRIVE